MLNRRVSAAVPAAATGTFRNIVESFLLLAIAVILFRGFAAEGFMISTGSMAPTLLGYHRRVVCPECQFTFARGANPDQDDEFRRTVQGAYEIGWTEPPRIRCPNCSLTEIPFQQVPRTEGDQLLVHKHAYEFRDPRRWEVIVFRNPDDPRQAYVKRVVGLPGEEIEIRGGNVYANGTLCRKPLPVRRAMRIPVSDWTHQVAGTDPDVRPEWSVDLADSRWTTTPKSLQFNGLSAESSRFQDWVTYRHWRRSGGQHETSVPLAAWPRDVSVPSESLSQLKYQSGQVVCVGVLSDIDRRNWLSRSDSIPFQAAINQLYEKTHLTGVVDESGYNAVDESRDQNVEEFCLTLTLSEVTGNGQFALRLKNSEDTMTAVLDFSGNVCRLFRNDESSPLKIVPFPEKSTTGPILLELTRFDGETTLAWNGSEILSVTEAIPVEQNPLPPVTEPAQFGAAGIHCQVSDIRLFRDVYYTHRPDQGTFPVRMGTDEFFVLGDNSPVSVDSRVWSVPGVPRRALIGKPLVVHLPSQTTRVQWNDRTFDMRLPDFSRARWIR